MFYTQKVRRPLNRLLSSNTFFYLLGEKFDRKKFNKAK